MSSGSCGRGGERIGLQEAEDEERRRAARHLTMWVDEDGSYVLRGRLDPESGAMLRRALDAASLALYRDAYDPTGRLKRCKQEEAGSNGPPACPPLASDPTPVQRLADAIGLVAEWALGGAHADPGSGEHGHADPAPGERREATPLSTAGARARGKPARPRLDSLETGHAVLESGVGVAATTARRIACDARFLHMAHGPAGAVLDVGRRSRVVPAAIRRALDHRDRGCRFPGCGNRYCDAHHIVHWAEGGATRLDNVVTLCRRHHTAVHEEGFSVRVSECGEVQFFRPDGRPLHDAPASPPLGADPAGELVAQNVAAGLEIDAGTPLSDWRGERLAQRYGC